MDTVRRRTSFIFVTPLLVAMILAFNLPLLLMFVLSFTNPGITFTHYETLIVHPVYVKVLGNTFRIAVIATVMCAIIGYPLAYWIASLRPRHQVLAIAFVVIPFWVSILVRTYAWIVVLGNAGVLNSFLVDLGLVERPVKFLYNELGVIIGTTNILLPFLVLPLYASMTKIDTRLIQAGESLGASKVQIFMRVFFPLTLPALGAGSLLVFMLTLGFFVTPAILGGGKVSMIANLLDILIYQLPKWELASAVSVVLLAATLVCFWFYRRLDRLRA